jgi:hypothetical protein
MSEPNPFERQLHCWIPRRPSAKLRSKLFAGQALADQEAPWQLSWRYFAPLTGIFLLSAVTFTNRNFSSMYLSASVANGMLAAVALSNQTAASYFTSPDTCDRNRVPLDSFETMNSRSVSSSSRDSFLLFKTNSLIK